MADSRKISEMPEKSTFVDADDIAIVDSEVADPLSPLKNKRVAQSVAFATLAKQADFDNHLNDDVRHLTTSQNDALDAADNPSGANEFLTRSGGDALYDPVNSAAAVQANLETHKTSSDHDGRYYTESEVDTLVAQKVAKAGDTMTGPLTLPGNPTQNLHAATKQYVDSVGVGTFLHADLTDTALDGHPGSVITIAGGGTNNAVTIAADDSLQDAGFVPEVAGAAAQRVAKSGDTMTGLLTLSGAPTADLHAATKKYVDDNAGAGTDELVKVSATDTTSKFLLPCLFSSDNSVTFTLTGGGGNETIDVKATGTGGGEANTGQNVGTGAGWYLGMNGTILQFKSAVNTTSLQWTSNANDLQANVQFGTGVGVAAEGNHLHPGVYEPSGNLDTHKSSSDHDGRYYTEAEVDALIAARVAKSGDTMTGLLTLSGAPTVDLHAATKKYVDDNVGGGGPIDGTQVIDWGDTGQTITGSGAQTLDLDNGHFFSGSLTASKTITFQSTAAHTNTSWDVILATGGFTPTWAFTGATVHLADGYDISANATHWFTFRKVGTDVYVSERKMQ